MKRRDFALGGISAAALSVAARPAAAAWVATPAQTEGPFYPGKIPLDDDNDLVRVKGAAEQAEGTVLHLSGRVLGPDGRAVAGARVEIWQCDVHGHYHHSSDWSLRSDAGFQGFGRMTAGADGGYRFRTIRPVPYGFRTPHIHFRIEAPRFRRLTTQMYVAGDARNDRDGIFRSAGDEKARAALLAELSPVPGKEPGALQGRFDIRLGRGLFSG